MTFATSFLSQFNLNHNAQHWIAAKRILRYLKNIIDYSLIYQKINDISLTDYTNANWANDLNDRKSHTGFVFLLESKSIS